MTFRKPASPAQARPRNSGHSPGACASVASKKIAFACSDGTFMSVPGSHSTASVFNAGLVCRFSHGSGEKSKKCPRRYASAESRSSL